MKKTILVTGSNRGIGFEIVRQLAHVGHEVILTARDERRGAEAVEKLQDEDLSVHFIPLDITDEQSLHRAAGKVKIDFGKLDVLINNAAMLLKQDQSLVRDDLSLIQQTLQVNAIAQLAVTRAFQSMLSQGRVIMTSSGGGSMTDPVGGWSPAYCLSKSLLNAMTRHLAFELSNQEIAVNAYCPGWVRTAMGGTAAPRSVEEGADTAVWLATAESIATGKFYRDRKVIPW